MAEAAMNRGELESRRESDGFLAKRRQMREEIAQHNQARVWGRSPERSRSDEELDDDRPSGKKSRHVSGSSDSDSEERGRRKKHSKKRHKSKRRSESKSRSRSRSRSRSPSKRADKASSKEKEKTKLALRLPAKDTASEVVIGPEAPKVVAINEKEFGRRNGMLRGEGEAMAAFLAEGKRIPRRGEVGWTSERIASLEKEGFVMSGSRHRRMEEVRIRKENQVITAAERRSLAEFHHDERTVRENKIMSSLRDLVHDRLHRVGVGGRTRTRDGEEAEEEGGEARPAVEDEKKKSDEKE